MNTATTTDRCPRAPFRVRSTKTTATGCSITWDSTKTWDDLEGAQAKAATRMSATLRPANEQHYVVDATGERW